MLVLWVTVSAILMATVTRLMLLLMLMLPFLVVMVVVMVVVVCACFAGGGVDPRRTYARAPECISELVGGESACLGLGLRGGEHGIHLLLHVRLGRLRLGGFGLARLARLARRARRARRANVLLDVMSGLRAHLNSMSWVTSNE